MFYNKARLFVVYSAIISCFQTDDFFEYHNQRELSEAKKELQEEHYNVRSQTLERENAVKSAMRQVEEMGKELAKALNAVTAAGARASAAEVPFLKYSTPIFKIYFILIMPMYSKMADFKLV